MLLEIDLRKVCTTAKEKIQKPTERALVSQFALCRIIKFCPM
jgi:hypothetical protein